MPHGRDTDASGRGAGNHPALAPLGAHQPSLQGTAMQIRLTINGQSHEVDIDDPRVSLLDLLRQRLGLTGTKKGCDHGQCGACTVLLDGQRINSCLTLAVMHDGAAITTIEGLGTPEAMSDLQRAFVSHDGLQCGYCTPGQIMSATAMLEEAARGWPSVVSPDLTAPSLEGEELRERMSGNLCRCSCYPNIVDAIRSVVAKAAEDAA